jgi:RNA polymerase sigma factor (sigma-70 family)
MQKSGIRDDEARLVDDCLQGKVRAQEALYQRFASGMYAICCRYSRDQDAAADVLQDGFIRVFQALSTFRKDGSLEGWVRRIIVNTALEHYRKNRSNPTLNDTSEAELMGGDPEISGDMGADDLLKLVQSLPDGYRNVFNLYAIEGYTHKEIADMLQINEGTSKSQLARARQLLQHKLEALMKIKEYATGE